MVETANETPRQSSLYETDFHAWTQQQATRLRAGDVAGLDLAHLAEEVEDMGRKERRELESRLTVLLSHLLKWQYQAGLRSRSWSATIREQRRQVQRHLDRNPSLKACLDELYLVAYEEARFVAGLETGYTEVAFPAACPYRIEDALDAAFWPD